MSNTEAIITWFISVTSEEHTSALLVNSRLVDQLGGQIDAITRMAEVIEELSKPTPATFATTLTSR